MLILQLATRSLRSRLFTTSLTLASMLERGGKRAARQALAAARIDAVNALLLSATGTRSGRRPRRRPRLDQSRGGNQVRTGSA